MFPLVVTVNASEPVATEAVTAPIAILSLLKLLNELLTFAIEELKLVNVVSTV